LGGEDGEVAIGFAHGVRIGDDDCRGTESIIKFAGRLGVDSKAFAEVVETGNASGPIGAGANKGFPDLVGKLALAHQILPQGNIQNIIFDSFIDIRC
jgi:hypothetical protein